MRSGLVAAVSCVPARTCVVALGVVALGEGAELGLVVGLGLAGALDSAALGFVAAGVPGRAATELADCCCGAASFDCRGSDGAAGAAVVGFGAAGALGKYAL